LLIKVKELLKQITTPPDGWLSEAKNQKAKFKFNLVGK
jgi:hypothetical protein